MPAVFALVAFAYGDSRFFLAPAAMPQQMAQPQQAFAGTGLQASGPAVPMAEPLLPEPVLPVAYPSPQASAASSSTVLAAAAGALLVAGAALAASSRRPAAAVAEPDLEAAESAVAVAMLFSSGSKATPKSGARKPAPKKAAAPKRKPAPKKKVAPKRTVSGSGKSSLMGGSAKTSSAENFAKNFASKDNWAFQAFSILRDLPKNNAEKKKTMIDKM